MPIHIKHSCVYSSIEEEDAQKLTNKGRHLIKGYISSSLAVLGYIVSVSTSQVAGNKTSIFLVNIFRFVFEIIVSVIFILRGKYSFTVAKADIYKFILAASLNYTYLVMFYLAVPLLPVGNISGTSMGIKIFCTTCFDVFRKHVSKLSILIAALAVFGLLLLTQPWHLISAIVISPCDYIDSNYSITLNVTNSNLGNASTIIKHPDYMVNPTVLGYTLLICSALASSVGDNVIRWLYSDYPVFCVVLWLAIIQALITVIILAGLAIFQPLNLSFPSGHACLGFTIAFIISMSFTHILFNVNYFFFPVSKTAVLCSCRLVGLYTIQRTLLKKFHPGNANVMEVCGIICIFVSTIASPVLVHFENKSK